MWGASKIILFAGTRLSMWNHCLCDSRGGGIVVDTHVVANANANANANAKRKANANADIIPMHHAPIAFPFRLNPRSLVCMLNQQSINGCPLLHGCQTQPSGPPHRSQPDCLFPSVSRPRQAKSQALSFSPAKQICRRADPRRGLLCLAWASRARQWRQGGRALLIRCSDCEVLHVVCHRGRRLARI